VKPEPGARMAAAAGGRGRLRASHADRERAIDLLKAAFVHGRLAKDEFDARVGQALASRTYADLAAVTADIPAGSAAATADIPARRPAAPPPRKRAARARPSINNAVTGGACVIVVAHLGMLAAFITGRAVIIVAVAVLTAIAAAVAVVAMVVAK
jgi:Domain of unknown function (DUF1707)